MKKIFTLFILSVAFSSLVSAVNAGWNNYQLTTYNKTAAAVITSDTNYVALECRAAQYQCPATDVAGNLFAKLATANTFSDSDSIVWKIVRGAPIGTTPRVRFVSARTGEYLYQGKKGGTSIVAYVGPFDDPYNGVKDFELVQQGYNKGMCYFITNGVSQFINSTAGTIGLKNSAGVGWRLIDRKGPQPYVTLAKPNLELSTSSTLYPTLSAVLNARVTGADNATSLPGTATLFHGTTLLDTLELDAEGKASFTYNGLVLGTEQFSLVYHGDIAYGASDSLLALTVVNNPLAKKANIAMTLPETAETNQEVKASFAVSCEGNPVNVGMIALYVNGVQKNTLIPNAEGKASIVLPVFGAKKYDVWARYIGEGNQFLNSDTAKTTITCTAPVSDIKPYPVTFDLAQQPLIEAYMRKNVTSSTTRPITHIFPKDSVPGVQLEDTLASITYYTSALTYASTDYKDLYMRADQLQIGIGSGYSEWINFTTPWLNKGNYNVYLSSRYSGEVSVGITSVTMDGKELYYPEKEYYGRFMRSWNGRNTLRRWLSFNTNTNLCPNYLGTVNVSTSDIHNLKISMVDENGLATQNFDFLQFVPVDQDSVDIGQTAAVSFAKIYKPVFDMGGFAFDTIGGGSKSFADLSEFSVTYQAPDQSVYTKTPYTITNLGNTVTELVGNYAVVYRKDKWTRVASGAINEATKSFTCELPNGDYYYQELNYIDLGVPNAAGLRTFISEGTFNIGGTGIHSNRASSFKPFVSGNSLFINGLEAGTRIRVYDVTGKLVVNSVSTGTSFNKQLKPSVYIVNIVSMKENSITKVVVR